MAICRLKIGLKAALLCRRSYAKEWERCGCAETVSLELHTYCVSPSAGLVVDFDLKKEGVLGKVFLGERRIAAGVVFILQKALKTVWPVCREAIAILFLLRR